LLPETKLFNQVIRKFVEFIGRKIEVFDIRHSQNLQFVMDEICITRH
jgi:hypothetical protein